MLYIVMSVFPIMGPGFPARQLTVKPARREAKPERSNRSGAIIKKEQLSVYGGTKMHHHAFPSNQSG
ncbi:MAG: hypothetical protein Q8N33_10465, partial [Rhodocyclaceae bacterium]|nr:hypothetical protein [Rhodocyclaceae bacterium]